MGSEEYFIDPPAASERLPFLRVVRVPRGGRLRIVILSTDIIGVHVHRVEGKPYLCPGPECKIAGCPDTGRYQGYIEAITTNVVGRVMVELTAETYHKVRIISVENSLRLRGLDLALERSGEKRNSPITVTLMDVIRDDRGLGAPRDMRPFIKRLYGVR